MPVQYDVPVGAPVWIELFTSDPDRAQDFYGQIFGWSVVSPGPEYGGYFNFIKSEQMIAGGMRNDGSTGMGDLWSVYLASRDNDKVAAAVTEHGGVVHIAPMQVMDLGNMCMFMDAGGAWLGAWQPGQHRGIGLMREPGAPAWFELQTRAYESSLDFYRDVFGWTTDSVSETAEFRYSTLSIDGTELAGVMDASMFLPEGVPSHWTVYFNVEDTDATVAQVIDLGGSSLIEAADSPYGRVAQLADPLGAMFRVLSH